MTTSYGLPLVVGSKIQVVGWTSYTVLICILKMALLVFYIRLTEGLGRTYRIRIYAGIALVAATFVASVLTIYTACRPFERYWQINPNPGGKSSDVILQNPTNASLFPDLCQGAVSKAIVWVTFASSVVTDIYLIMIPLPMLWGTSLKLVKKIASTVVLGAGIFVLVCSMLKTIFVYIDPVNGAQLAGEWGTREAFVSVATTNLPMLFPLLRSCESEERIINNVKMQDLKVYAGSATSADKPSNGIVVSNEFQITEDRTSQNGEQNAQRAHEPCMR
ncbi:hypothetical protein UCRPA7_2195 [Phaeoacremonium minimum UCRPA7]|uniref:Rhodopsin domain-containing protein n=1 Tax=Phaeoacremonium minimum (strain UCR-PA7) TaxID=1286976 RepID=R8BSL1_PHAM7|nr:hypothetical protein UCRPA7_2195 [Phaeoacremonium minimum UCRPA7]EOO02314.1 hypothetical protein UCRPA7_2195 [Phaeoacremonium minimum UCRPA7]